MTEEEQETQAMNFNNSTVSNRVKRKRMKKLKENIAESCKYFAFTSVCILFFYFVFQLVQLILINKDITVIDSNFSCDPIVTAINGVEAKSGQISKIHENKTEIENPGNKQSVNFLISDQNFFVEFQTFVKAMSTKYQNTSNSFIKSLNSDNKDYKNFKINDSSLVNKIDMFLGQFYNIYFFKHFAIEAQFPDPTLDNPENEDTVIIYRADRYSISIEYESPFRYIMQEFKDKLLYLANISEFFNVEISREVQEWITTKTTQDFIEEAKQNEDKIRSLFSSKNQQNSNDMNRNEEANNIIRQFLIEQLKNNISRFQRWDEYILKLLKKYEFEVEKINDLEKSQEFERLSQSRKVNFRATKIKCLNLMKTLVQIYHKAFVVTDDICNTYYRNLCEVFIKEEFSKSLSFILKSYIQNEFISIFRFIWRKYLSYVENLMKYKIDNN
ncbi:hypothetical protein EDEG_03553 [Edhazardia aedis USNM 41457]|uniref:Transmembrane protein n=1 Tax=Edhazardia aedis (strain USNM 41457) TaxID=1003232 RepID=J8ZQL0_EDHAE|nr:hypothetical protein EDEG_03553 [Edhazardia aedis USNM 41457]|eukprot:EJW01998.1 hypothetical protein EDEG_03553 [Edhazardia aedis USNM 41457]